MADVNHVILVGRLTRDAELKYTTGGFPIANVSLAINRRRKNGEQWIDEANFFDVDVFGKTAESLKQYLTKGKQIAVEGELRQDRWEQPDGQKRSKVTIAATNIQLLGGSQGTGGVPAGATNAGGGYTPRPNTGASRGGYEPIPGDSAPGESYDAGGGDFVEDVPF